MTECIGCVYANKHGWENQPKCEITGDAAVSRCAYYRPSCKDCGTPMVNYIDFGWTCDHCEEARSKRITALNETALRQQMRY